MANLSDRLPGNVPGRYYVDGSCIDCDLCRASAPDFFRKDDDSGLTVVHRQPSTPPDVELVIEAKENCPANAIGDDG